MGVGEIIVIAVAIALLIWATATVILNGFFARKEKLINKIIRSQKGTSNGS